MSLDRLIAIVRRELGSDDVRVVPIDEPVPEGSISCPIPAGRRVVAILREGVEDQAALQRRLEMLVESFGETLRASTASRPPPSMSLHAELQSLAQRASAVDALVIDAQSPVVWGAAEDESAHPHLLGHQDNVIAFDPTKRTSGERATTVPQDPPASRRAIDAVRALPQTQNLHRGGHLHTTIREQEFGWIARSFASIYVLVLVFDTPFDELGAERAIAQALPIIERLVTSLPPMDPTPVAGAAAIRRRRR
ncbi:MAG: hypothetical protein ACXWUG_14815 [Polyangiales bacterium]